MNWPRISTIALFAAHVAGAAYILLCLYTRRQDARAELQMVREIANREQRETEDMQRQVKVLEHRKIGLHANDPYVIELMARERYESRGQDEIRPPPLPARAGSNQDLHSLMSP